MNYIYLGLGLLALVGLGVGLYFLLKPRIHSEKHMKPIQLQLVRNGEAIIDGREFSDAEFDNRFGYVMDFAQELGEYMYVHKFSLEDLKEGYERRDDPTYSNIHFVLPQRIIDLNNKYPIELNFATYDEAHTETLNVDAVRIQNGIITNLGSSQGGKFSDENVFLNAYFFKDNANQVGAGYFNPNHPLFK